MAAESGNDGLLDGIFQMPEHADVAGKKFKPWHLPRKHWVRINQWCEQTAKLIHEIQRRGGMPCMRYFSLPGDDLLDIRTLHGVCERKKVPMIALGLNSSLNDSDVVSETNLSLNEVHSLEWVDAESTVLPDRLEHIASTTSVAYRRMREFGPFDVINLDLCESFASAAPGQESSYYAALDRIIDLQLGHRRPWLMFLTTRADQSAVNVETMKRLMKSVRDNIAESDDFGEYLNSRMSISPRDVEAIISDDRHLYAGSFSSEFGLGLAKWLLRVGAGTNPPTDVELVECSGYRVQDGLEIDMLSLVFRIQTRFSGSNDPYGVMPGNARRGDAPTGGEREDLGRRIVDGVAEICDVDSRLYANGDEFTKAKSQMKTILKAARYPVEEYDAWVEKRQQSINCGCLDVESQPPT